MFRLKKGKWICGRKDTWGLATSMSPIIAAGLREFIVAIQSSKHFAIPCDEVLGEFDLGGHYVYFDEASAKWLEILGDMLYAFDNPETPDIPDGLYDRWIDMEPEDRIWHSKPELMAGYEQSVADWKERRERGLEYTFKFWDNLWW